jgi:hypothetical protein
MNAIWLQLCNAVGILVVHVATKEVVHSSTVEALGLRHWALLMCKQQCLQVDNLLAQLGDGSRERIVLSTEQLNLSL